MVSGRFLVVNTINKINLINYFKLLHLFTRYTGKQQTARPSIFPRCTSNTASCYSLSWISCAHHTLDILLHPKQDGLPFSSALWASYTLSSYAVLDSIVRRASLFLPFSCVYLSSTLPFYVILKLSHVAPNTSFWRHNNHKSQSAKEFVL